MVIKDLEYNNLHLNVPVNGLDCISEHVIPSGFWASGGPQTTPPPPPPPAGSQASIRALLSLGGFWLPLPSPTLFEMENPDNILIVHIEIPLFIN